MNASETDPLLDRLTLVSTTSLADASKATSPLRMLPPALQPVRPDLKLVGRALTVDASDGLMSMLAALSTAGPRDVLVVAGGGVQATVAVAGELFASEALRRGVTGLVIDGYCRDRTTLATLALPVYARGSVPNAPGTDALPVVGLPISIGGVTVNNGDLLVGDADGIVVGTIAELDAVIDAAEGIEAYETGLREAIQAGGSLLDHVSYDEHLAALQDGRTSRLRFG